jgi:hypothetical protein
VPGDAVEYTVTLASGNADRELPSMQQWLARTGTPARSRRAIPEPDPGQLGAGADALMLALGPGGVAIAVIGAVVTWLRGRRTDVALHITSHDGRSVKLTAQGVRGMDADAVTQLIEDTVAALERPADLEEPASLELPPVAGPGPAVD